MALTVLPEHWYIDWGWDLNLAHRIEDALYNYGVYHRDQCGKIVYITEKSDIGRFKYIFSSFKDCGTIDMVLSSEMENYKKEYYFVELKPQDIGIEIPWWEKP